MAPLKTRWKCNLCDCICEKRPAFKHIHRLQARRRFEIPMVENESGWVCDNCLHPAKSHHFTFDKPGQEE